MINGNSQLCVQEVTMEIEESRKNNDYVMSLTLGEQKKYVYSKYNPRSTAKSLINHENINEETIWFVYGAALGYVAEELLDLIGEFGKIIIIEPTIEMLNAQKQYFSRKLQDERVIFLAGNDEKEIEQVIHGNIQMKDVYNVKVIAQPVYKEFFSTYYKVISQKITQCIEVLHISLNTLDKFKDVALKNTLKNLDNIKNSKDIRVYEKKYSNIPAVVVSAGPSLNKNIRFLKDFKGLIITGTRTLPKLKELGITPHFLACLDPGEIAFDLLKEYKENDINLIMMGDASPSVGLSNKGEKYFVTAYEKSLTKAILDLELPNIQLYGSVATLCMSAAQYMGCNPIIFIGQDLAYTDMKAHADNFNSYEVNLEDTNIRYVEDINGERIASDVVLVSYLRWIEAFIRDTREETTYINCTEGGAKIERAEHATFSETIKKYNDDYKIEFNHVPLFTPEQITQGEAYHQQLIEELKMFAKVAMKGKELSLELQKEYTHFGGKRMAKINKLVERLRKEVEEKLQDINPIIDRMFSVEQTRIEMKLENKDQINETVQDRVNRNIKRSITLYSNAYDAIQDTLDII